MIRNRGGLPGMAIGRRVRVVLENGADSARHDPPHWPADMLDWSISPETHPSRKFDIREFEVVA